MNQTLFRLSAYFQNLNNITCLLFRFLLIVTQAKIVNFHLIIKLLAFVHTIMLEISECREVQKRLVMLPC